MASPDDHRDQLLHAARGGDDDALGELIENFRPMLRADAARSLTEVQGRVDASDVVQLTWWSAFRGFPRFGGDLTAFVGWLKNIHERNLRDAVRDQRADKRDIGKEVTPSAVVPIARAKLTSPSQKLMRKEQQEQIDRCLLQLPAAQREAIRLRFQEEFSIAEIVQQMGRSETAVAGLLKRGLSALRVLMIDEQA